jgi:hypothetical protein
MGQLFDVIRGAVSADRYLIGQDAAERLDERGIPDWQVVESLAHGTLLRE